MKEFKIILVTLIITLFAVGCGCNRIENKYDVIFDSNGGTAILTQSVKKGESASKPMDPKRDGYIFKGWYLNDNEYDFSKKIEGNITLKAEWESECSLTCSEDFNLDEKECKCVKSKVEETKTYTVTFDSNGGTKIASQTVKENETVTKPTNPTKNGYTFTGWYLNGKSYNFNTKVTSNITLKASYKVKETKTQTQSQPKTNETKTEEKTEPAPEPVVEPEPEPVVEPENICSVEHYVDNNDSAGQQVVKIKCSVTGYTSGKISFVVDGITINKSVTSSGIYVPHNAENFSVVSHD